MMYIIAAAATAYLLIRSMDFSFVSPSFLEVVSSPVDLNARINETTTAEASSNRAKPINGQLIVTSKYKSQVAVNHRKMELTNQEYGERLSTHLVIQIFCLIFVRIARSPLRKGLPGCRHSEARRGITQQLPYKLLIHKGCAEMCVTICV